MTFLDLEGILSLSVSTLVLHMNLKSRDNQPHSGSGDGGLFFQLGQHLEMFLDTLGGVQWRVS